VESEITNFEKHLCEVRLKKKMSQGNNAKKLRIHRSSGSGLERWKRNPSLLPINKMA
jgi:DNA-binding XRE family transcriptional regulator